MPAEVSMSGPPVVSPLIRRCERCKTSVQIGTPLSGPSRRHSARPDHRDGGQVRGCRPSCGPHPACTACDPVTLGTGSVIPGRANPRATASAYAGSPPDCAASRWLFVVADGERAQSQAEACTAFPPWQPRQSAGDRCTNLPGRFVKDAGSLQPCSAKRARRTRCRGTYPSGHMTPFCAP